MASDTDTLLRLGARLLPREFRERVLEPALADLERDERGAGGRRYTRLVLLAECLRIGLPEFVWRRGRLTRLGATLILLFGVAAVAVQRTRYGSAAPTRVAPIARRSAR